MSAAWEITPDDVATVFRTHGIKKTEAQIQQIFDEVFVGDESVENFVLDYTDFDDQVEAALFKIEDMLIEENLLPGSDRKYKCPSEIDFGNQLAVSSNEDDEDEWDDENEEFPWHKEVEIGNIIVIKDGVVDANIAIMGMQGVVVCGKYESQKLAESLEAEFWEQCRAINDKLPVKLEDATEEQLDDNFPSIDDGYYEYEGRCVCLTHATKV